MPEVREGGPVHHSASGAFPATSSLKRLFVMMPARLKRLFVGTPLQIGHAYASDAAVFTIQRLFAEPLINHKSAIEQYPVPGAIIDCNALLDIPGDGDFVEAAFRQVLGREIPDQARCKWLARLRWIPRIWMLARLRSTTGGWAHVVEMPGLWRARASLPARASERHD
jgi:hypothetical protein